jgi:chitin synthase
MIAATYGLQAVIFILKREFMLIGWMVVYIISYDDTLLFPCQF